MEKGEVRVVRYELVGSSNHARVGLGVVVDEDEPTRQDFRGEQGQVLYDAFVVVVSIHDEKTNPVGTAGAA